MFSMALVAFKSVPQVFMHLHCSYSGLLQESLEEERFEKFKAMSGMTQLKTELEGLKEWVAKKPVQNTEVPLLAHGHAIDLLSCYECQHIPTFVHTHTHRHTHTLFMHIYSHYPPSSLLQGDTHTRLPTSPTCEEGLLMSEVKTLRMQLAKVEEDLAKAAEHASFAQEERRDMKEQLYHTLTEKFQQLAERLQADADRAQQDRREMKEQLDCTVAEKLLLEDQLVAQKRAAKDWKLKLDETTCKLIQKEDEVNMLRGR